MLKSGEVDAFIHENPTESVFDIYGDVVALDFFPNIRSPVSLTTQKPELEPVISIVQKSLLNGGADHLRTLYYQGFQEYRRYKFFLKLSEDERAYIKNNNYTVRFAAEHSNYPLSFYNKYDKEWQGVVFDIFREVEAFTGLKFERANDGLENWPVLLRMLESGEAVIVSELFRTRDREGHFFWPETALLNDRYALISSSAHRNIMQDEVWEISVGYGRDTAFAELFNRWYPDHPSAREYESSDAAFEALFRNEVDMVMSNERRLITLINIHEVTEYKANVMFDFTSGTTIGINIDHAALATIIDKALSLVDVSWIASKWLHRTFDYQGLAARQQRPWFIGSSVLLTLVIFLLVILFQRTRHGKKRLEQSNVALEAAVRTRTLELEEQTLIAIKASRAKSTFLANMSHEIRTPLNAVIGLSDVVLARDTWSSESKNDIRQIHQSGSSLLGLINDILDISKIEAGGLELVPVEYETASFINDTINLNKIRIGSKPILFTLEISGDFPRMLLGDELRVRQALNNILSNAIKYTDEGEIKLTVRSEKIKEKSEQIVIYFSVQDSGIGIRPENMKKLFLEYTQLDTRSTSRIEGTGLGLAITKKLVETMGGAVSAESEYGKGSVFTISLVQGLVPSANGSFEGIGEEISEKLKQFLYVSPEKEKDIKRAWMPYGKVLLVDDMPVNLQVARGLLEPYGLSVDTALSGPEAIDLVKAKKYDLVFMDHMMPGMDGIEAVRRIRAWEAEQGHGENGVAIVALTANVLVGNMEMFMSRGFNGFVPKPIDIVQLDEVLNQWVRDKQKTKHITLPQEKKEEITMNSKNSLLHENIPGLDIKKGLAMSYGKEENYRQVLSLYCQDVNERLPIFQSVPETDALPFFVIQVHALKSASASIGANEVSELAAKLEAAGKQEDLTLIKEKLPVFSERISELVKNIGALMENRKVSPATDNFGTGHISLLKELDAALESNNGNEISRIMQELEEASLSMDSKTKDAVEQISDEVMMAEYDSARKIVKKLMEV
jgi:signal transduction histidine kinase/DNA-binding response OmpR family regulator